MKHDLSYYIGNIILLSHKTTISDGVISLNLPHPIYQVSIYQNISNHVDLFDRISLIYNSRIVRSGNGSRSKRKLLGDRLIPIIQNKLNKMSCQFEPFIQLIKLSNNLRVSKGYSRRQNNPIISYKLFYNKREISSIDLRLRSTDKLCEDFRFAIRSKEKIAELEPLPDMNDYQEQN